MIDTALAPSTRFTVPDGRTATTPPEQRGLGRDEVRLLIGRSDGIVHTRFRNISSQVKAGDVLVFNNSATLPAELDAWSSRHGAIVLHIATRLDDLCSVIELRAAPDAATPILDAAVGDVITATGVAGPSARLELIGAYPFDGSAPGNSGNRLWQASANQLDLAALMAQAGRPISYGYLQAKFPLEAYQTVFSRIPGSAEMPSAGRPFTHRLVTELVSAGAAMVPITLHTGVSSQEAGEGPQAEWFEVPPVTAAAVNSARHRGSRVIAVGTTATRALESAVKPDGRVAATSGWTEQVVTPNSPPRVVNGLITGWHNPDASHLLLVEAIAGAALTQRVYDSALAERYLWHEFGDSALLLP